MSLELPPLRTRSGDVALLASYFLPKGWRIASDAMAALESYHWPGNVRQLSNVIERATVLADNNSITIDDLPGEVFAATTAASPRISLQPRPAIETGEPVNVTQQPSNDDSSLALIEQNHVKEVLRRCGGNKARAARSLGIHRRKLYRLLERFESEEGHRTTGVAEKPGSAAE